MSLSLFSPSRTILMTSDEALYIYSVGAKGAKLQEAVPWTAEGFVDSVATIIAKDCGGKSVLILHDMVEQHYRKEKVPSVSVMDKQNVLKRKLKVAFPNYPVRAALPLKEKIAKGRGALGGRVYIFAAVPSSDAFAKTMEAATKSLAPISGFCLLPIESSDMIKKLSDKLHVKGEQKPQWTVFMGHHRSGGLRQVVIKNGEIALTRMTPVSEFTGDTAEWARDVNQEFNATMSYLSRFGFDPNDGLNVILISDPAAGDAVGDLIETPCNFYSFTADTAAKKLGIRLGAQESFHYADSLHSSWIGRKARFILPMKAKQIDSVSMPRQIISLLSVLLLLGGCFQAYQLFGYVTALSEVYSDIETSEQRQDQLTLQFDKEIEKKEELGYDIKLIQSALGVHDKLEEKSIDLMPLFYSIGRSLGRDMRIDSVNLRRTQTEQPVVMSARRARARKKDDGPKKPLFTLDMQMTFPSTTNAEKGNEEVEQLKQRLQSLLPDHVVKVSKFLEDYEYSEEIVVQSGDRNGRSKAQDYAAEIIIEGPLK